MGEIFDAQAYVKERAALAAAEREALRSPMVIKPVPRWRLAQEALRWKLFHLCARILWIEVPFD